MGEAVAVEVEELEPPEGPEGGGHGLQEVGPRAPRFGEWILETTSTIKDFLCIEMSLDKRDLAAYSRHTYIVNAVHSDTCAVLAVGGPDGPPPSVRSTVPGCRSTRAVTAT